MGRLVALDLELPHLLIRARKDILGHLRYLRDVRPSSWAAAITSFVLTLSLATLRRYNFRLGNFGQFQARFQTTLRRQTAGPP